MVKFFTLIVITHPNRWNVKVIGISLTPFAGDVAKPPAVVCSALPLFVKTAIIRYHIFLTQNKHSR